MTRDEILNMKAGRGMDALIATHFTKFEHYQGEWWWQDGTLDELPDYSTNIYDAWNILERFKEVCVEYDHGEYIVTIVSQVHAKTAPLAICRAALLTVIK